MAHADWQETIQILLHAGCYLTAFEAGVLALVDLVSRGLRRMNYPQSEVERKE